MPGDPLRAKFVAETYLENPVLFNDVRNMYGYTGTYEGTEVSVMGSGMGVPSMGLYAHELYNFFDVESIIRIGSAGALQDEVHVRDVVLAMTASTNSACVNSYDMVGYPAPTADYGMLKAAAQAAEEGGVTADVGSVYTSDYFYHPQSEANMKARNMGCMCVEMETAGLYLTAMANHKKALSILTISDHIITGECLTPAEIRESFHEMMVIALKTAVRAG
jgi:purine-nucleoside phosphorylase